MIVLVVVGLLVVAVAGALVNALWGGYLFGRYREIGVYWWVFLFLAVLPGLDVLLVEIIDPMMWGNEAFLVGIVCLSVIQVCALHLLRDHCARIPRDLFEAAEAEGAGGRRLLVQVVLPGSKMVLGVLVGFGVIVNMLLANSLSALRYTRLTMEQAIFIVSVAVSLGVTSLLLWWLSRKARA